MEPRLSSEASEDTEASMSADLEPRHCVLLRAGGQMSMLDMAQGLPCQSHNTPAINTNTIMVEMSLPAHYCMQSVLGFTLSCVWSTCCGNMHLCWYGNSKSYNQNCILKHMSSLECFTLSMDIGTMRTSTALAV